MEVTQGQVMDLLSGEQVIIQTSGPPVQYQTVVHTGNLGSVVHAADLTSSNHTVSLASVVASAGLGSLDAEHLDTVVHTGHLDTVQLVHSYNLPPSAEKEQTVVEQLLLQAGLPDAGSKLAQETIISFKKPIFLEHLREYYSNCQFADTTVICSDETRRVHSFVLGAASSLMKEIFGDLATKILDTEMTIMMPDIRAAELDLLLRPVYGLVDLAPSQLPGSDLFSVDYNRQSMMDRVVVAENEAVAAASQGHFLEQPDANYNNEQVFEDEAVPEIENTRPKSKRKKAKPKNARSKYGYKYDGFIDDSEDEYSDDDWEAEEQEPKPKKAKSKPRPKKIKEEDDDKVNDDEDFAEIEPLQKLKEDTCERRFNELNEFYNQQTELQSIVCFNQDDQGVFHCEAPGCNFSCLVRASVQQHILQTHVGGGYLDHRHSCSRCGEGWTGEELFKRHLESTECLMGQELPYVCETCGKGWFNLTNYTRHIEGRECKVVSDSTSKHKCISCPLTFFSLKNREVHVRRAHLPPEESQYRCAGCDYNFVTNKDFGLHRKIVHGNDGKTIKYSCRVPDCGFDTLKREELAVHVHSDHPNQIHLCDYCGRNFASEGMLTNHMTSHSKNAKLKKGSGSNYDCPHCPREFNRKRHMELHVLFKHSNDRPFSCEQCGKKFKTRHCVNIHLRSHGIGGYSWCCEECGKTFNQISAYHVHLKVHSSIREFACEDCGMTFKLKHSLKKHQLVHKAEFGHTCDFCGKKFKRSDNLINHRRRHTGEHPYKCDRCNWTGPDSSSFIHHKKKHNEPVNNLGTISQGGNHAKPVMFQSHTANQQDHKPIVHIQAIQEIKPQQVVSIGIVHPEIKLIHAISKIQ